MPWRSRGPILAEPLYPLDIQRRRERGFHEDGRVVTIPIHGGRQIGPPLYQRILRQLGVSTEEFQELL